MRIRYLAAVMLVLGLSACRSGLLFRNDHRVEILKPELHSSISQPVEIQWSARDFTPGKDGKFAVFIDRDPMPPGEGMDYFAPRSRTQGVFLLNDLSLKIDTFNPRTGVDTAERDHHDVTVVLLDPDGRRIGESAGFSEFRIKR